METHCTGINNLSHVIYPLDHWFKAICLLLRLSGYSHIWFPPHVDAISMFKICLVAACCSSLCGSKVQWGLRGV